MHLIVHRLDRCGKKRDEYSYIEEGSLGILMSMGGRWLKAVTDRVVARKVEEITMRGVNFLILSTRGEPLYKPLEGGFYDPRYPLLSRDPRQAERLLADHIVQREDFMLRLVNTWDLNNQVRKELDQFVAEANRASRPIRWEKAVAGLLLRSGEDCRQAAARNLSLPVEAIPWASKQGGGMIIPRGSPLQRIDVNAIQVGDLISIERGGSSDHLGTVTDISNSWLRGTQVHFTDQRCGVRKVSLNQVKGAARKTATSSSSCVE